jgi:aspartyl-tRNA(Asn)/glutamyl-tRNA(Gln) amidotransferase subunit B
VPPVSVFARKNYFSPDLPKGYQISQYEQPLAVDGWLEVETASGPRRVRIRRVHLEEDTGKLSHAGAEASLVDLNRAGVPLLEIVTEPDLRSAEDVRAYAVALRSLLRYLDVNSGDMEKGVIRFEPNLSVRPAGSDELRTRVELKNLNSFRALERASAYEIERQIGIYEAGGSVLQETRGWDEARGETVPQRGKEHAHDYRYFPEPDLPPLVITPEQVEQARAGLPELPAARRARFRAEYGLSLYDAALLTEERAVADFFEQAVAAQAPEARSPKAVANWMTGELFRLMNASEQDIGQVRTTPAALAALIALQAAGSINTPTAKAVFAEMFATGQAPETLVIERGLGQLSDDGALRALVDEVLAATRKSSARSWLKNWTH